MSGARKSVRRKLTELILGSCFCVLAVTLAIIAAYEVHSYRQATVRSLSTLAEIIAENSAAVLLFDDQKLAQEILGGLRVEPEVAKAALFNNQGKLYATYPKGLPAAAFPSSLQPDGVYLGLNDLTLWKPVMQGTRVGTIFIKGDLGGTYQRLGVFGLVLLMVGLVSIAVAIALSHFLQRRISQPLAELATSARQVTSKRDYTIRAAKTSDDEIGDLTEALNAMLDEIHANNRVLHEQEEKLRTLADNMAQLAWIADERGNFLWYNKRWHDYTGLDFAGSQKSGWTIVHPDFRARIESGMKTAFAAGTEWEDTFPLLGKDGQFRWFLSRAIPIHDVQARVLRWFGTNTDVTELRAVHQDLAHARDEALAASAAKDEFLAKLSHELRTPLNPVLLLVSDEDRNKTLPEEIRQELEIIKTNVELEARLIDDLLDLTAVVRGKLVLHRQHVPINDIVRDAIQKIVADANKRSITIRSHWDVRAPIVNCDPVRTQQVFWNVLKNAVKFSRNGGVVMVSTVLDPDGTRVKITITDDGMGMSPVELAKIFDAFAQGDHAAGGGSHRFGGLGLGLAIARRVVDLHGGTIVASSAGRDKGSTFVVDLPVNEAPSPLTDASTASPPVNYNLPAGAGLSVLLVEDHEPTSLSLERLLSRRHFKVVRASSANEARAAFLTQPFDLFVSDIGLPDGSGYDLMQEFRTKSNLVGVALTGYGMESDVALARTAGFTVHLTKPVRVESLDHALIAAIESVRAAGAIAGKRVPLSPSPS